MTTRKTSKGASAKTSDDHWVVLGRIKAAHGIQGDLLISSYTEIASDIAAYGPLTARHKGKPDCTITLRIVRETPKGIVARASTVTNRNDAEALRGAELLIARDDLPETGDGEFYHADLIGLTAVDAKGKRFGRIAAVANYGAGDLLEVEVEDGKTTELVPFTQHHVPEVRLASGEVVVNWPLVFEIAQGPDNEPDEAKN